MEGGLRHRQSKARKGFPWLIKNLDFKDEGSIEKIYKISS